VLLNPLFTGVESFSTVKSQLLTAPLNDKGSSEPKTEYSKSAELKKPDI